MKLPQAAISAFFHLHTIWSEKPGDSHIQSLQSKLQVFAAPTINHEHRTAVLLKAANNQQQEKEKGEREEGPKMPQGLVL